MKYYNYCKNKLYICNIIGFLLLLYSCQKKSDNVFESNSTESSNIKINLIQNIKIKVDEATSNIPYSSHIFSDDLNKKELVCTLNSLTNSVQLYSLDGKKQLEIICEKEGPNGVGEIASFLYCGIDSLYVLNTSSYRMYRVSNKGTILNTYILPPPDNNKYYSSPFYQLGSSLSIHNNKLFIPSLPGIFYYKDQKNYLSSGMLSIVLDLKSGLTTYQIPFPNKELLENSVYSPRLISPFCIDNIDNNERIYSFNADHAVYSYTSDGKLSSTNLMKSKFTPKKLKELPYWTWVNDPIQEFLHFINNTFYEELYYDPYRKLYYRLVKHGASPEMKNRDFNINEFSPNVRYSIIISDKGFNILDEINLANNYLKGLLLISRKGIMIQNLSNKYDEDHMYFDLYEISI